MPAPKKTWLRLTLRSDTTPPERLEEFAGTFSEIANALGAEQHGAQWLVYFPADAGRTELDELLMQCAPDTLGAAAASQLVREWEIQQDENWAANFREHFHPIDVPPRFRIAPPWREDKNLPAETIQILINPGQGFGTGTHETTQLCLGAMAKRIDGASRVLDAGSGSGILSIAAVKLGAAQVVAVEFDPAANDNARENFQHNGVESRIDLVESDPDSVEGRFSLIVCNMLMTEIEKVFASLVARLGPDGHVVFSGFLLTEREELAGLVEKAGGRIEKESSKGEWGLMVWGL